MGADGQNQFASITTSFLAYLPSLLAGIGLVLLGLLVGWVAKKVIVQLVVLLRVDRMLLRSRWKEDLKKADVRYSLYNFVGNFAFAMFFLIFLDNAFIAWKLTLLSDLLGKGILYLPTVIIAAVIWGLGWFASSWIHRSVLHTLLGEDVPRAALVARFIKAVFVLFFSAMAMVELDVAKEIVIIRLRGDNRVAGSHRCHGRRARGQRLLPRGRGLGPGRAAKGRERGK